MKSNLLSKSDTAEFARRVAAAWRTVSLPAAKNARAYELDGARLVDVGGVRVLEAAGALLPFLGQDAVLAGFPSVTVDMGAVRFMCNGANVMRPGIRKMDEFGAGELVCVVEESQRKFLAVGTASAGSAEAEKMERGEVVKNLHYISDRYWEGAKEIRG